MHSTSRRIIPSGRHETLARTGATFYSHRLGARSAIIEEDSPIHPFIALFEQKAQLLETSGMTNHLDDAIAMLAQWLAIRQENLTEDDMTVLSDVGAIFYREGLRQRRLR